MHPRTAATLRELSNAEWFARVGIDDAESAIVLSSWDEAIDRCSSLEWENLCQDVVNGYSVKLMQSDLPRYQQWNDHVDELKLAITPMVESKTAAVVAEHDLPKVFVDTVQWDILHIALEAEYADVLPPGFYIALSYWYAQGHFPCGWEGEFPDGRQVVF